MHLILVDRRIVVLPADQPAAPDPEILCVTQTGELLLDGEPRRYYAALAPHRLLIVMRHGRSIEEAQVGLMLHAAIGWDDGHHPYVTAGGADKRHSKITVIEVLAIDDDLPADAKVTALSDVVARAPRSDRPGGQRTDMPGRPPIVDGDSVEAHNVTLPSRMWRRIEAAGEGNRSAGIRKLIEQVEESDHAATL